MQVFETDIKSSLSTINNLARTLYLSLFTFGDKTM